MAEKQRQRQLRKASEGPAKTTPRMQQRSSGAAGMDDLDLEMRALLEAARAAGQEVQAEVRGTHNRRLHCRDVHFCGAELALVRGMNGGANGRATSGYAAVKLICVHHGFFASIPACAFTNSCRPF